MVTKGAMDARRQSYPSPFQPKQGRKLDLIKCDRCRLDKQKCTPTTRIWPTKCDRCIKKGFSCSTGRRVIRTTKHVVNDISVPLKGDDSSENYLDTLVFLVGYHEIFTQDLDRIGDIRRATIKPFMKSWGVDNPLHGTVLGLEYGVSEKIADVTRYIRRIKYEMFPAELSAQDAWAIATPFMTQALLFRPSSCLFCNENDLQDIVGQQGEALTQLQDFNLLCNEYQFRQKRLVQILRTRNHVRRHHDRDAEELTNLRALQKSIQSRAKSIADELGGPSITSEAAAFVPDEIALHEACLGRIVSEDEDESEDIIGRTMDHLYLEDISRVYPKLLTVNGITKHLDHKDFLGRTLLHIACMNNEEDAVEELLDNGADPAARTIFGSLPLHYAAATASEGICRMLLEKQQEFDVHAKDEAGQTARDYANDNWNWTIFWMLEDSTGKTSSSHEVIGRETASVSKLSPPQRPMHRVTPSASEMPKIALVAPHDATLREPAMIVYEHTWVPNSELDSSSSNAERPNPRNGINPVHADSIQTTADITAPNPVDHLSYVEEQRYTYPYLEDGRLNWR